MPSPGIIGPRELLVRAVREHLKAAQSLARDPAKGEKLVHQVRTGTKRLRASWRLMRRSLPDSVFRREKDRLRMAAQSLAAAREREVMARTLGKLRDGDHPEKAARLFAEALQTFRAQACAERGDGKASPRKALSVLFASLRRLAAPGPVPWGWDRILPELGQSYRKARKAYRKSDSQWDSSFHAWRKRSKDLGYQLEALSPVLPQAERFRQRLEKLQGELGNAQDLAVLEGGMDRRPRDFGGSKAIARMRKSIRAEKRKLRRKSLRLGRKIFAPVSFKLDGPVSFF